jgi:hypothetical protein
MGAWGIAAFDNDDAADWFYELEANGVAAIDAALSEALGSAELEMPTDVNAIAAGEVVAAALGRPVDGLREDILAVAGGLAGVGRADHAARAIAAAERVLASSEVNDLWAETDDHDAWRSTVQALIGRLAG